MDQPSSTGLDHGSSTRWSNLSRTVDPGPAGSTSSPDSRYRAGVKEDFDRLYRATYQRVFASLVLIMRNPAAAEDAAQEGYLRAFKAWKSWKQEAPAEAWLYRTALN